MNLELDKKLYLDSLTWLRGIAAFFVIVSHTVNATEVTYFDSDNASKIILFNVFNLGSFGVLIFFVLSGCTLFISNVHGTKLDSIFGFYAKRFFRIWPAFAFSLVLYLLFRPIFVLFYTEPQGLWIEKQFLLDYSLSDLLAYITLTSNIFVGDIGLFNNAYWSLPVEFQYYLLFPLIVLSLLRIGLLGPIIIAGILYAFPRTELSFFKDDQFFVLALSFCGGVLIGHLYKNYKFRLPPTIGLILLLIVFILVNVLNSNWNLMPDLLYISNRWNFFCIAAIVTVGLTLFGDFKLNNAISNTLKYYGQISYGTYLYHNLFVALAVIIIIQMELTSPMIRIIFTFVLTFIGSLLLAGLSYKYIEQPFISFSRNLAKQFKGIK